MIGCVTLWNPAGTLLLTCPTACSEASAVSGVSLASPLQAGSQLHQEETPLAGGSAKLAGFHGQAVPSSRSPSLPCSVSGGSFGGVEVGWFAVALGS